MYIKPEFGRFGGPQFDYTSCHCVMAYKGRELLGQIHRIWRDEVCGVWRCEVRHNNGELWPIEPILINLKILDRRWSYDSFQVSSHA